MPRHGFSINHIGLAVPNIPQFLEKSAVIYGGFSQGAVVVNDRQRVREVFLSDGRTTIELLEPLDDKSPIHAFLGKNPHGGLVHVALNVDALEPAVAEIRQAGGLLITKPAPDVAFDDRRIAFAMVAGQIVELIERPRKG